MKEILLNLGTVGNFPKGIKWIINIFQKGKYPNNKSQLDEWAMNFHPYLSDFKKLLCNFEEENLTSILKKVQEQSNDIIAMFG